MDKVITGFLETEITYQDYYDGIIDFIINDNIRNGEYECNEYIIKKMDLNNFIIFPEYTFPTVDISRIIPISTSIYRDKLIEQLNDHAKKQGLHIIEPN
ncbi:hypothetical protein HPK19_25360 (plasmid) [Arthrobacter citreus]|nr:hypothetical protein HPK19_25360 [Arthrobacter citreus]